MTRIYAQTTIVTSAILASLAPPVTILLTLATVVAGFAIAAALHGYR